MAGSTIDNLNIRVTSDGITKASTELDKLGNAADSTEKKVLKLVTSVEQMVQKFSASVSGTKAITDALAVVNRTTVASDAAMKALTGSISKLTAEISTMSSKITQSSTSVTQSTTTIRQHTVAMSDAQAAARGLSGSLGALWLTYGNLAPLAAGAAIGYSLKQIVSTGAEVENTLEAIRLKGEASISEVVELRKAIVDIGQGIYGPQEVSKAFETLILAGLKAKEAVNGIGAALNLATAGGSTIEKAAESLVTIGTAVGATAQQYDYLADGITKAANISLASVDSIAEAVKRASVVNKLYGASFEDILTQTAALAQLGIKNTAAGTAITNFYANSQGSTEKARAALDALGFSFQDVNGKAKAIVPAFEEFSKALGKFDLKSQKNIITSIFGERALRDVESMRDLVNASADDTTKYANKLEEIQGQIATAAGTSALVAAQQALTAENQIKSVGNTLSSVFVGVFKELEPSVVAIAQQLRSVFASDDFRTTLTNIASGFVTLAKVLADNIPLLTAMAEGFLAVGIASAGGALFSKMIPLVNGLAVAFGAVTVAADGAAVATGLFGTAIKLLPGIGIALSLLTAAFVLFELHTKKSKDSVDDLAESTRKLADVNNNDFLSSLEAEAKRIEEVNKGLSAGKTLTDAQADSTKKLALEKQKMYLQDATTAAQAALFKAQDNFDVKKIRDYTFDKTGSAEAKAVVEAQNKVNDALKAQVEFQNKASAVVDRIVAGTQKQGDLLKQQQVDKDALAKANAGTQTFDGKKEGNSNNFFEALIDSNNKWVAGHTARMALLKEEGSVGAMVAGEVATQEALAALNSEAAAKASKGMSAAKLQEFQMNVLASAVAKDNLKFDEDRAKAFEEFNKKLIDGTNGYNAYRDSIVNGSKDIVGNYGREAAALAIRIGLTKDETDALLLRAKALDENVKAADQLKKLESATTSSLARADQLMEQAAAMGEYGSKAKSTALNLAKAKVAELDLNDAAVKTIANQYLKAAAYETVAKALDNITKIGSQAAEEEVKAEADSLLAFADSEKKKVQIKADAQKKIIALNLAQAASAAESGDDKAVKAYQQTYEASLKAIAQIDETTKLKMHNVELEDWKKTVNSIVDTGLAGFDHIFDKGTSIWKSLTNSIREMFQKTIIDYIKKEFAKPFLLNVVASVGGSLGLDGLANAANAMGGSGSAGAAGASGSSGALSAVSAASSLYKMVSGGFEGISSGVANAVQGGLDKLGLSMTSGAPGTLATSIGSVAGSAAGIAAGLQLNKFISGDYKISSGVNTVEKIATVAAAYFGPVASTVVGAVSGLLNRAFGRGPKETTAEGIRGTISDSGSSGINYQDWTQKGGWFRSTKKGTDTSDLTSDFTNTLSQSFMSLKVSSEAFAKTVGISSGALDGFTKSFDIQFKGLKEVKGTAEEQEKIIKENLQIQQDAVTKFLVGLGDEFANKLIPNIAEFALQGESASITLERLSGVFAATNQVAALLGKTVQQAFGSDGLSSDKVRETLVTLAGGIDALTSKTTAYVSAIYNDADKLAPVQKALADAFKELNIAVPTSKDNFKALVDSLDLTDASQAKLFNSLLDLAPIFAQVSDAADQVAQSAKDAAQALKDAADAAYKAQVDLAESAYSRLEKAITAQKAGINSFYDAAVKAQKASAQAQIDAAKVQLTAAQDNLKNIQSVFDAISNAIESTKVESNALDMARRKSAQELIKNTANSGQDVSKVFGLGQALKDVAQPSQQFFKTFEEYAYDQAVTKDNLSKLQDNAQTQIDFAKLTVDRLNDTIDAIQKNSDSIVDALEAQRKAALDSADNALELARAQLDTLKGIDTTLLSVQQALSAFSASLSHIQPTGSQSLVSSSQQTGIPLSDSIQNLYKTLLGREGESSGVNYWLDKASQGWTITDLAKSFMNSQEYKNLHPFAIGTNFVPQDMPAMVHKGERIIPASDNAELMKRLDSGSSSSMSNSEIVAALDRLQTSIEAGDLATVQKLSEMLKINRKWDGNGLPETRDVTA